MISKFFNTEDESIKNVNFNRRVIINLVGLLLFAIFMTAGRYIYEENKYSSVAIFTVVNSGNYFSFNGTKAKSHGEIIDSEFCNRKNFDSIDYVVKQDFKVVCTLVIGDSKEVFNNAIKQQRYLFLFFFIICLTFQIFFFVNSYRCANATKFLKKHGYKFKKNEECKLIFLN